MLFKKVAGFLASVIMVFSCATISVSAVPLGYSDGYEDLVPEYFEWYEDKADDTAVYNGVIRAYVQNEKERSIYIGDEADYIDEGTTMNSGSRIYFPDEMEHGCYKFKGWLIRSNNAKLNGNIVYPGTELKTDSKEDRVILFAIWSINDNIDDTVNKLMAQELKFGAFTNCRGWHESVEDDTDIADGTDIAVDADGTDNKGYISHIGGSGATEVNNFTDGTDNSKTDAEGSDKPDAEGSADKPEAEGSDNTESSVNIATVSDVGHTDLANTGDKEPYIVIALLMVSILVAILAVRGSKQE